MTFLPDRRFCGAGALTGLTLVSVLAAGLAASGRAQEARATELAPLLVQSPEARPAPDWLRIAPGDPYLDLTDPAVPGATEVLVDTPDSRSWPRYQGGTLDGWSYRLFPDGSGLVLADRPQAPPRYVLICRAGQSCGIYGPDGLAAEVPAIGAPKPALPEAPDALALARYLAEWALAGTGTPPPAPAPKPVPAAPAVAPAPDTAPQGAAAETATALAQPASGTAAPKPEKITAPMPSVAPGCVEPNPFDPTVCMDAIDLDGPAPPALTPPAPVAPAPRPPARASGTAAVAPPRPAVATASAAALPPSAWEKFVKDHWLSCNINTGLSLKYTDGYDYSDQFGKLKVGAGCWMKLNDKFSFQFGVVGYPVKGQQAPWDPDFTYSLTYQATKSISFNYSNYTARFSGGGTNAVNSLKDGSLRMSYKLPEIPLPWDRSLACSTALGLPDPSDAALTVGCSTSVTDKFRLGATAYFYPDQHRQETWDPDFTYTASYQLADRWLLSYANYAANRFPWNKNATGGPGLLGGSLSISYKLKL
ncbi:hypothetical protein KM176_04060 [Pseudooceanicola sp. CBS1P-1]|uniref:Uncharacterized protein n=1 Tax=Pseudooceanicola albus TaxID=2692189 RepID=A0A6L7G743_9RHOB|nr:MULTISPECIES: hypothetical protein [Pseudooceanicola]MBT9383028.1 hypothetical protein [Pseudooceanicola endophyticus]MXN19216.1 hypothetical protein [Pseudooceanicola albus]